MSKVTLMLTAGLLLVMSAASYSQIYPRFGYFLYKGPTSIDVYVPKLTNPDYSKAEFYVNGKKFATADFQGPEQGVKTATGLTFGPGIATLQIRFIMASGAPAKTGTVVNAPSFATDGWGISTYEFYGVLAREEKMNMNVDLSDTLYIIGEGEVPAIPFSVVHQGIPGSNVPGGHLVFESGGEMGFDLQIGSNLSTVTVFGSSGPGLKPGQISATGGKIVDLIVYCHGQFGPANNFTVKAANFLIDSNYPTVLNNVTVDWDPDDQDFGIISSTTANNIIARNCIIQNESQILGIDTAYKCRIYKNSTIWARHVIDCDFDDGGNLSLKPAQQPTSCTNSDFVIASGLTLSNKSVVQLNTFDYDCYININVAGFDPADIKAVHVNYNHFKRGGSKNLNITNTQADTLDFTLNYWGRCEGPDKTQYANQKIKWFPFLREPWPATSYWLEITRNKDDVIANDQDELIFDFHFYNVVTNADSAGVGIDYLIKIFSDTLLQGTLTTDAQGRAQLKFTVPFKYRTALSVQVFFSSIQCNGATYSISVKQQSGSDLAIYVPELIQLEKASSELIAQRGFAVRATISASEPIITPYKMVVTVNGEEFDEFAELTAQNVAPNYSFNDVLTETTAPNNKPRTYIWFINKNDIDPGSVDVTLTIDPQEAGKPQGRVQESNEINNSYTFTKDVIATAWGNDGATDASFFVQPIDPGITNVIPRTQAWTDSAMAFMEKCWPTLPGSFSATVAPAPVDYDAFHPDTMMTEDWQPFLVNIYKEIRKANPNFDRYVFAVNSDWFSRRIGNHKLSQTLTWSGVYDLAVASVQWYKHIPHTLGHTYHLKRQDLDRDDESQLEEYATTFLGKTVDEGYDVPNGRIMRFGQTNEANQPMQVYSFMGAAQFPGPGQKIEYWISGENLVKLIDTRRTSNSGHSQSASVPCILIDGRVDSVNMQFEFGPWSKLPGAVPSAMVQDQYAKYIFKAMDGSNTVLAAHNYTPTFRALGLDETTPSGDPHMLHEYFAFAMPFPAGATKIVLEEAGGGQIFERLISNNPPQVTITPAHNTTLLPGPQTATWSATDPDGDTEFWYTMWFSTDDGNNYTMKTYQSKETSFDLGNLAIQDQSYVIRVRATDGINEATAESWFHIKANSVKDIDVANDFVLLQNYPNPFNPSTTLTYNIPAASHVRLEVFDALGRVVRTLADEQMGMGTHTMQFNADGLPSGTYTAVLTSGSRRSSVTMTLSK